MSGQVSDLRSKAPVRSEEVARWDLASGDVGIVEIQEFENGPRVIAVRRWYRDRTDGTLKPGRAGISFHLQDMIGLGASLRAAVAKLSSEGLAALASQGRAEAEREDAMPIAEPNSAPVPARRAIGSVFRPPSGPSEPPQAPAPALPTVKISESVKIPADAPTASAQEQSAPPSGVTLAAIMAKGLVGAPLQVRIEHRRQQHKGVVYSDGSLVFGNRRYGNPKEAVADICGMRNVVDAWKFIQFRNPATRRFARLSRLRNTFLGLEETADD